MYSAYKLNKQGDNIQPWPTPFLIWNQSVVPMSSSNCCFLTCIQISQEAGQVVWYSHLFKNFPQFVVIHTVKGLWYFICYAKLLQLCLTLCNLLTVVCQSPLSMGFSRQEYCIGDLGDPHGIQWDLEWSEEYFSKGSSLYIPYRDPTHFSYISCIGSQVLYHWRHLGSLIPFVHIILYIFVYNF